MKFNGIQKSFEQIGISHRNVIYTVVLSLLMLISIAECTRKQETGAVGLESIRRVEDAISHAVEAGDVDAYLSNFTDGVTILIPDKPIIRGKDALRSSIQPLLANNKVKTTYTIRNGRISGNWAYVHVSYRIQLSPKNGEKITRDHGEELVVFRRYLGEGWKVYSEADFNADSGND